MCPHKVILKTDSVIAETYYHIRPKDDLYGISKAHNIPIWQLAEWDNIEDISPSFYSAIKNELPYDCLLRQQYAVQPTRTLNHNCL